MISLRDLRWLQFRDVLKVGIPTPVKGWKQQKTLDMNELKELSLKETQALGGGSFWSGVAVSVAAAFMYEVVNDWENNVKAFKEGYESFR